MTRAGFTANASSLLIPHRSKVPGAEHSIQTSEIFHSAISNSSPCARFKSIPMESLFFMISALSQPWGLGPAGQEGRDPAKRVAARPLDMNYFGAEFGQLCADEGLRDEYAGTDGANAFERAKAGSRRRRIRALQSLYPLR